MMRNAMVPVQLLDYEAYRCQKKWRDPLPATKIQVTNP